MPSAARLQASHELRARIGFLRVLGVHARQEHPRLDLGQRGGHEQIFAGQLELQHLHQFDIAGVLAGDLRDRNIEYVEILPPDQIQEQIERTFEGLQEHFERLRRDVQISGQLGDGLAFHDGKGHLCLLLKRGGRGGGRIRHEREVWSHRASEGFNGNSRPWPAARHPWSHAPLHVRVRSLPR
jgi:hypothetical protein